MALGGDSVTSNGNEACCSEFELTSRDTQFFKSRYRRRVAGRDKSADEGDSLTVQI